MEAQEVGRFAELREGERAGAMCHRLLAPLHLCPCLQLPEPGLMLEMWALLLSPKSGSRFMAANRGQAVACGVSWAHRVVWVEKDLQRPSGSNTSTVGRNTFNWTRVL